MCSDRLAVGEAPACVQACPHEAISIKVVDRQQVIDDAEADHFLPAAPDPQITLPTTRFKTSRVFPRNTLPADYHSVNPQHPHWPLIVMLVLTQLSVGRFHCWPVAGIVTGRFQCREFSSTARNECPRLRTPGTRCKHNASGTSSIRIPSCPWVRALLAEQGDCCLRNLRRDSLPLCSLLLVESDEFISTVPRLVGCRNRSPGSVLLDHDLCVHRS